MLTATPFSLLAVWTFAADCGAPVRSLEVDRRRVRDAPAGGGDARFADSDSDTSSDGGDEEGDAALLEEVEEEGPRGAAAAARQRPRRSDGAPRPPLVLRMTPLLARRAARSAVRGDAPGPGGGDAPLSARGGGARSVEDAVRRAISSSGGGGGGDGGDDAPDAALMSDGRRDRLVGTAGVCLMGGLRPGTWHRYRVRTLNDRGWSPWSEFGAPARTVGACARAWGWVGACGRVGVCM
jgi:hypothetical protein